MRPVAGTGIIAAYAATAGALRAVLDPGGLQDGPRVAEDLEDDVLFVGWSPDAAMTANHDRAGMGNRIDESFELRCLFSTASGDTDLALRHQRVEEVLELIVAICATDRPLAGTVDRLGFGSTLELQQEQTSSGAVVELRFSLAGRILR